MAILTKRPLMVACLLAAFSGCGPLEVVVFEGEGEPAESEEPPGEAPPPTIIGLGGRPPMDEEMGGAPSVVSFLLDDFEDNDQKSNDPGGWWYSVNDGSGIQTLGLVSSSSLPVPQSSPSLVLESESRNFSSWGAAWGVDIESAARATRALEVRFDVAAAEATEIEFHAIDATGTHFIRTLQATSAWNTVAIQLHELFVVEGQSVRGFDVVSATELQWFVFSEAPRTVWLDNVWLSYW